MAINLTIPSVPKLSEITGPYKDPFAKQVTVPDFRIVPPSTVTSGLDITKPIDVSVIGPANSPTFNQVNTNAKNYNSMLAGTMASVGLSEQQVKDNLAKYEAEQKALGKTGIAGTTGMTEGSLPQTTGTADTATKSFATKVLETLGIKDVGSLFGTPEKVNRTSVEQQFGIAEKQKKMEDYQSQLNAINAEAQQAQLALESQAGGKDITTRFLGKQQQEIERQRAISALPIAAALSSAQGAYENAVKLASQAVDDEKDFISQQNENRKNQINIALQFATEDQKIELERAKSLIDSQNAEVNDVSSLQKSLITIAKDQPEILKETASIKATDPQARTKLSALYAKVQPEVKTTAGVGVTGKYSDVINTILGSGTFTDAQATRVINAINSGQNPLSVVKNQAKNIMGQTLATDLSKAEKARDAMLQIQSKLKEYYDAGGDTNVFAGTWENLNEKVGTVSDPARRKLATQIESALQIYRNAVSGTAYSVQEGKAIAAIFPGINKTQGLNEAVLSGRMEVFNDQIDSAYRSTLGDSYDILKGNTTTQTSKSSENDPLGLF